jgi:hypothetical protein
MTEAQRQARRETQRRYRERNREAINARGLLHYHEKGKFEIDREAKAQYNREYAKANPRKKTPEQSQADQKRYYERHRERLAAEKLALYHENGDRLTKEERSEYNRKYREQNPEKCKVKPEVQKRSDKKKKERYAIDPEFRMKISIQGKNYRAQNYMEMKLRKIQKKYGLIPEQYYQMLREQGNKCKICFDPDRGDPRHFPFVDHCHKTGRVRGLICKECNHALGLFQDSVEILRRAADYLEAGLTEINQETNELISAESAKKKTEDTSPVQRCG